jgi:hypothetical protein
MNLKYLMNHLILMYLLEPDDPLVPLDPEEPEVPA